MVAALFVETNGIYFGLPNVDPWDVSRDARLYAGPYPVVAHPPCDRWHQLSAVNHKRWGFAINEDGGCFASALNAVRTYGGVLEHPAESRAFKFHGIPEPVADGWQRTIDGDWVTEIWQSSYGHRARKRTWLLYSGKEAPPDLEWRRTAGTHQIGFFDQKRPQLPKAERAATPVIFRDLLLSIALMGSRMKEASLEIESIRGAMRVLEEGYERIKAERDEAMSENDRLRKRLGPHGLEIVEIDGAGHYVNEKVKAEIDRLRNCLTNIGG